MAIRAHTYADDTAARAAIEAIDTARPEVEQATTYLGKRSTEQAIADKLATVSRRGALAVTAAGIAEGYAIDGGRLVRHHTIPARTWAQPIELADGTFAVPVCAEVAGVEVETRAGKRHTVPDDSTARTITAADRREEPEPEGDTKPVDVPVKGGGR